METSLLYTNFMLNTREKRLVKKVLSSFVVTFILFVFIVALAPKLWEAKTREQAISERQMVLQQQLKKVNDRFDYLKKQKAALASEVGLQEILRETFDVGKEGEKVLILVDDTEDLYRKNKEVETQKEKPKNFLDKLFGKFYNR